MLREDNNQAEQSQNIQGTDKPTKSRSHTNGLKLAIGFSLALSRF